MNQDDSSVSVKVLSIHINGKKGYQQRIGASDKLKPYMEVGSKSFLVNLCLELVSMVLGVKINFLRG